MKTAIGPRGRLLYLLSLLAALALVIAACDEADTDPVDDVDDDDGVEEEEDDVDEDLDDEDDDDEEEEAAEEEPAEIDADFLTLATGSTGGTYYPLGGAMTEAWNDELDLNASTQATGASVENLRLLDAGELELIMAVNGVAFDAYEGVGEFEGEDMDFVALGNVYPEVLQIVARADAGIDSIEDLDGARVAIGPPGSGTEVAARELLELAGLDVDSDIDAFSETFGDATDQLQDGQVDAAFAILALPAGGIEEVATNTDINIVNIDGEIQEQMLADDESYSVLDVPADTYTGQADDAVTLANWATLYAPADFDEDLGYELVRVMYESSDRIADTIAVGEQIQIDTALDGLGPIPLHAGAERYFEEQGALD